MDAIELLESVRDNLLADFASQIQSARILYEHFTLSINFVQGIALFVRYNDFGEYSYQITYSQQENDFDRYDNFDDRWEVSTRPHHLHAKNTGVIESPMTGEPSHDLPILSVILKQLPL